MRACRLAKVCSQIGQFKDTRAPGPGVDVDDVAVSLPEFAKFGS